MIASKKQFAVSSPKLIYMPCNVILTFNDDNRLGESQEFFDLKLPISTYEQNAVTFLHNKLFRRIAAKCEILNRSKDQLLKISTASDWDLFETKTGNPSLPSLGHSGKWHFGAGRLDLDLWERRLMEEFGFGIAVDMSWVNKQDSEVRRALWIDKLIEQKADPEQLLNCVSE